MSAIYDDDLQEMVKDADYTAKLVRESEGFSDTYEMLLSFSKKSSEQIKRLVAEVERLKVLEKAVMDINLKEMDSVKLMAALHALQESIEDTYDDDE